MTAQEIQQNMTHGEWGNRGKTIFLLGGKILGRMYGTGQAIQTDTANAHAITTAVNNTYGKGLDPEQYMPLRNAAAALYAKFSKEEVMTADDFEELNNVLVKAIIEPNKVLGK